MSNLPVNVYRVTQSNFDTIPGEPWPYWLPRAVFLAFAQHCGMRDAEGTDGNKTADNFRFIRLAWELPEVRIRKKEWRWSGRTFQQVRYGYSYGQVVDWGAAARWFYQHNPSSSCLSEEHSTQHSVSWSRVASQGFSARRLPAGYVPDVATPAVYLSDPSHEAILVAILNSRLGRYFLSILNPTINYSLGDVRHFPLPPRVYQKCTRLTRLVVEAERLLLVVYSHDEWLPYFVLPVSAREWGVPSIEKTLKGLDEVESGIDQHVYRLYDISEADRIAIEAELAGEPSSTEDDENPTVFDDLDEGIEPPMDEEALAVRCISYAVGIVLGRFRLGLPGALGSAAYRRRDFAVGSLPLPDEEEFNELVGLPDRFAYIDEDGGRHVFPAEVEDALRDLALDDGIAVLDEGHPRDLVALVEKALALMLDFRFTIDDLRLADPEIGNRKSKIVNPPSAEVIAIGAGGDLRKFLERDFFTKWHVKWYSKSRRKAPVYWWLQSAKRSYGFVLFHEKIRADTLYTLQRDYLDYKRNGLRQDISDLTARLEGLEGSQRRRTAREVERLTQTLDEIDAFAETMARIVQEGYEPEESWIDDGVILRMAPLWELIPIWSSEPKKYWARLEKGEYDWSHIAMHYWPDRVRAACRENKSFAIAHGLAISD